MRAEGLDRAVEGLTEPFGVSPRSADMLKLAAILFVLMILFGVLGFVVHVAAALTKVAFFVCLIALGVSLAMRALKKES